MSAHDEVRTGRPRWLGYLTLPWRAGVLAVWFAGQVLASSGAVLVDALTPRHRSTPRVVRVPLGEVGDRHVFALAVLVTLTPGTLALGVVPDGDGRALLVHSMYHPDAATALADVARMDRRLVRGLTTGGGA
ncbi:Na+/H+ antiporter subunit E [Cellulomonas phragmiteti]|uniref:Sodium:proton antiporter n=1 Tax=Cellulomonas phragmiteti TaxID=478780 RepID=A0ABQ4DQF5_9CELL|nr:Na+/H+ antiporter subunit E [Cellulomonas phragmiteti]GIG41569.1 hypothetical protein Cph01nite_33310 [Cellulomonas phragmiteti]